MVIELFFQSTQYELLAKMLIPKLLVLFSPRDAFFIALCLHAHKSSLGSFLKCL